MHKRTALLTTLLLGAPLGTMASCGDEPEVAQSRGAPGGKKKKKKGKEEKKAKAGGGRSAKGGGGGGEAEEEIPDHPKSLLTRDDFSTEARDPFQRFMGTELVDADVSPRDVQRQREVQMSEYNYEDLTLIGIVMSGRGIQPRALFVAGDGRSKSVKQGEYFSRAEVLLAAVNRDYIEIEVVDEELAKGLNMGTGDRRPVYLKKE